MLNVAGEFSGAYDLYRVVLGRDPVTGESLTFDEWMQAGFWTVLEVLSAKKVLALLDNVRLGNKLLDGVSLTEKELKLFNKLNDVGDYKIIDKVDDLNEAEKASGVKGKLIGSLDGLTKEEINAVDILRSQGKDVEIIPVDPKARIKTPDFKIDGVRTELKTLGNPNTNTGMKRIQEAFKQNANDVIINGIDAGLTKSQAEEILARAAGKYPNGKFPGKVEIWTKEGTIVSK
ncbi:pre-toxin TG domain-containing protein [Enterococcus sp. LJL51]|uniref:CdiA C-terminal domain-containing protein n=1 Tax=Enterococcus sp. LJL51 TaxID=3416656 RepID=UPI003CF2FA0C